MPWLELILVFVVTIALSCFACAGYHADNKKRCDTNNITEIAQAADFIVNGYAFTSDEKQIRVLNLNNPNKASVLNYAGEVLMTSMDDIEISIVQKYFKKNKEFLRDAEASTC